MFSTLWITPELKAAADHSTEVIVREIETVMLGKVPQMSQEEAHITAQVLMYMIKGLLPLVETADPEQRPAIIREFKQMGTAYLTTLTGEEQV